jgi:hypothetical protein
VVVPGKLKLVPLSQGARGGGGEQWLRSLEGVPLSRQSKARRGQLALKNVDFSISVGLGSNRMANLKKREEISDFLS